MDIIVPEGTDQQDHGAPKFPARCPICDGIATSGRVRRADSISTGDWMCSRSHVWQTKWFTGSAA